MSKKKNIQLPSLERGLSVVDTHCHLDMEAYDADREQIIAEAIAAGISRIISIGIDLESSQRAVELAENHRNIFATVGIHPHNVADIQDAHYEKLIKLADHPKVVGYGEIGLDYAKKYVPEKQQKFNLQRQVKIAKELDLPLIIHDRDAHGDTMAILKASGPFPAGGVMHCFSGDRKLADEVLNMGFYISIPGVVTFNKADTLKEAVRHVPITSLLLETDAPFLAPVPRRGKRNLPAYVLHTAQKVAELKNVTLAEVARQTTKNAEKLFRFNSR